MSFMDRWFVKREIKLLDKEIQDIYAEGVLRECTWCGDPKEYDLYNNILKAKLAYKEYMLDKKIRLLKYIS